MHYIKNDYKRFSKSNSTHPKATCSLKERFKGQIQFCYTLTFKVSNLVLKGSKIPLYFIPYQCEICFRVTYHAVENKIANKDIHLKGVAALKIYSVLMSK